MTGKRQMRTHHGDVVQQDAWVKAHGETLHRGYDRVTDPRIQLRLRRVLDALIMGHTVVQQELDWALARAEEALA